MRRIYLVLLFLFCNLSIAHATTLQELNQQVDAFENSGSARFSPATMKKVHAYLGASMLAADENTAFDEDKSSNEHLNKAVEKTLEVLNSAKINAESFQVDYADVLKLEAQADKIYVYHHKTRELPSPEITNLYETAKNNLENGIAASEQGKLNQAKQAIRMAGIEFDKMIDAAMPGLIEQTDRALSQAASTGAKKYAPRTWHIAEAELGLLQAYQDDLAQEDTTLRTIQRPEQIGYALEMAVYAQKLAIQIKAWNRDKSSYEKLILNLRQEHIDLAHALKLDINDDEVGLDIDPQTLLKEVKSLQSKVSLHQGELLKLQQAFDVNLAKKLQEQRLLDQQEFQHKITSIKSAFHTKLEQETFEKKRLQKIKSLFKGDEAEMIVNLDGSLIIRAKKIQFSPGSSKVDGQYFDFLSRIKEALMLYPQRHIKIEGHTDSTGDAKVNRKLSLARAESVQQFLVAAGMDAHRLKALGYGEAKPIATNMYKKGRAMNRRIDIIIEAEK